MFHWFSGCGEGEKGEDGNIQVAGMARTEHVAASHVHPVAVLPRAVDLGGAVLGHKISRDTKLPLMLQRTQRWTSSKPGVRAPETQGSAGRDFFCDCCGSCVTPRLDAI